MHAAAISAFPARPSSNVHLQERDISNHACLMGRSGKLAIYPLDALRRPATTAPGPRRNQQKSIEYYWDQWVREGEQLKPPGTQIHSGQMVRKQSLDVRFGGALRPPSRFRTHFGLHPHDHTMGHSYHQPEVTSRVFGASATPADPPRTMEYWKMVAPHLDPKDFMSAVPFVSEHGSVSGARRATTPHKVYKGRYGTSCNKYTQPTTLKLGRESHYPPGQEPEAQLSSADSLIDAGMQKEREADEITDMSHHSNSLRKDKMYKQACSMYQLATSMGSPEGKRKLTKLKERGLGAHSPDSGISETKFRHGPP